MSISYFYSYLNSKKLLSSAPFLPFCFIFLVIPSFYKSAFCCPFVLSNNIFLPPKQCLQWHGRAHTPALMRSISLFLLPPQWLPLSKLSRTLLSLIQMSNSTKGYPQDQHFVMLLHLLLGSTKDLFLMFERYPVKVISNLSIERWGL